MSYLERTGVPTQIGAQNEQNQWDYEHAQLLKKYPGGNEPNGTRVNVKNYVEGCLKLIHARLISRAEHVAYYARRQWEAETRSDANATTKRRERKGNVKFGLLLEKAEAAQANINEVWKGFSEWAKGLDALLLERDKSIEHSSSVIVKPAAQAAMIPETATAPVPTPSPGPRRGTSKPKAMPRNRSAPPRVMSGKAPFAAATSVSSTFRNHVEILRAHQVEFRLKNHYAPQGEPLIAMISAVDAERFNLPRTIAASTWDEKTILFELDDEQRSRIGAQELRDYSERPAPQPPVQPQHSTQPESISATPSASRSGLTLQKEQSQTRSEPELTDDTIAPDAERCSEPHVVVPPHLPNSDAKPPEAMIAETRLLAGPESIQRWRRLLARAETLPLLPM